MPRICITCVKEPHLKKLVLSDGDNGECSLCHSYSQSIDSECNEFFQLTKALVRLHYSEWDYNHHLGGDSYEGLFYGDENIFFDQGNLSDEKYEDFVLSITEGEVYEDYNKGVSIFSGYSNGDQNMPLKSIKTDLDEKLLQISKRLKNENYFLLENEVKDILKKYADIALCELQTTDPLYRARIGYKDKKKNYEFGIEAEYHYAPYISHDIGAPPPNLASNGRVNRPGVSFLYCATDKYTAISEVRPHPGDIVSLGKFYLTREARAFDLSDSKFLDFYFTDEKLDQYKPLNTLGVFLNRTIPPSERIFYSITQLVSDCIRQLGFDGVLFNSSVGTGKNIVLFDKNIVDEVANQAEIVVINNVKYEYRSKTMIKKDGSYE
ncbi:MAG: hypothetical protein methR_P2422 [Methyloprofundus sp.]|nr:MAG: hypothetical protein methR_P2422 [Methyloprofundus sp.]